jgi:hypothetical protein
MENARQARSRVAGLIAHGRKPGDPELDAAYARLREARLTDAIELALADLTQAQRNRLAVRLITSDGAL